MVDSGVAGEGSRVGAGVLERNLEGVVGRVAEEAEAPLKAVMVDGDPRQRRIRVFQGRRGRGDGDFDWDLAWCLNASVATAEALRISTSGSYKSWHPILGPGPLRSAGLMREDRSYFLEMRASIEELLSAMRWRRRVVRGAPTVEIRTELLNRYLCVWAPDLPLAELKEESSQTGSSKRKLILLGDGGSVAFRADRGWRTEPPMSGQVSLGLANRLMQRERVASRLGGFQDRLEIDGNALLLPRFFELSDKTLALLPPREFVFGSPLTLSLTGNRI